jgi:metal-responsive CopG/Arc/MetJ family transcriptional regulator
MRRSVSISLSQDLGEELDRFCEVHRMNRSEVAQEALRRFLAYTEFQRLRTRLVPHAERQGVFTDDDVFERLL